MANRKRSRAVSVAGAITIGVLVGRVGVAGPSVPHAVAGAAALRPRLEVSPLRVRAGDPVSVRVTGLPPGALVTLHAQARPEGEGEQGADAITVEQVVHWGTAGGAKVLGFDGVGTLAAGQAADIAVYELDAPRYMGLHDPAIGPVVCGGRPALRWLLANGKVVVENDTIPGLDMDAMRREARAAVTRPAQA